MEIYVRAEVPEFCYIHEATHWVAFAIPPVGFDSFDTQESISADLDHMCAPQEPHFFAIAPVVDQFVDGASSREFSDKLNACLGRAEAEILDDMQRLEDIHRKYAVPAKDELGAEHWEREDRRHRQQVAEYQSELEAARAISPTIDALNHLVEIARSKLFAALAEGAITSRGINPRLEGDIITGEFESIPHTAWRMSDVDWDNANLGELADDDELRDRMEAWVGVQVPFKELVTLFPSPNIEIQAASVKDYGGCLVPDGDAALKATPPATKSAARRSAKAGNAIRTAVRNEFQRRLKGGHRPQNRESLVQDCIGWVSKTFEEEISRSTAQRYLEPLNAQIESALAQK
ncbi:hypothetical protein [Phaeobacter piscinae]|uniref:hypothetical protein n=1 Tax=Phaeobacter piscinae TaxID=1580596 RepID=UPI000590C32B|nr:hypothetical protein [Phaeobacter piscinae]UTS79773.1 hypothetical protein OL67_000822 [Phaeobacter piscinae]